MCKSRRRRRRRRRRRIERMKISRRMRPTFLSKLFSFPAKRKRYKVSASFSFSLSKKREEIPRGGWAGAVGSFARSRPSVVQSIKRERRLDGEEKECRLATCPRHLHFSRLLSLSLSLSFFFVFFVTILDYHRRRSRHTATGSI